MHKLLKYTKKCKLKLVCNIMLLLLVSQTACRKFIDVDPPPSSVNEANVYADAPSAIAVLTGLYARMSLPGTFTAATSISVTAGLSADELTLYNGVTSVDLNGYYKNTLFSTSSGSAGTTHWKPLYNYIFTCNAAIEGLSKSNSISTSVKQQLLGEAKFLRAFFYFYLVNLFGDVPMVLTTDPIENMALERTKTTFVYNMIIADLIESRDLLADVYLDGNLLPYQNTTPERVRPTKWAASALLARVYLYLEKWAEAEKEARFVISNKDLFNLTNLNETFLKNSREAILQLQPVNNERNAEESYTFIIPPTGPTNLNGNEGNPVYMSDDLLNAFEDHDERTTHGNWIDSVIANGNVYYYSTKYKNITPVISEYLMLIRLSELYLIRAEANAHIGDLSESESDLNTVRARAGLPSLSGLSVAQLLSSIYHERQVELFAELGHRWLDLKRTNMASAVMPSIATKKGGSWEPTDMLYPILFTDISRAPNITQNPGYE